MSLHEHYLETCMKMHHVLMDDSLKASALNSVSTCLYMKRTDLNQLVARSTTVLQKRPQAASVHRIMIHTAAAAI